MWYFTFAANNRLLRKNTTFSLSTFSNDLKIFVATTFVLFVEKTIRLVIYALNLQFYNFTFMFFRFFIIANSDCQNIHQLFIWNTNLTIRVT